MLTKANHLNQVAQQINSQANCRHTAPGIPLHSLCSLSVPNSNKYTTRSLIDTRLVCGNSLV